MQPSSQGIASMFMGNPGALAARVDQDRKQSPMGIPDDLRQLMALNIVTTENDAAKRQQALQQLQQMAPNGQPPTVAENVRQQAAQKLQARMVQEQQKAQAMQQMMGGLPAAGIPQGVPQPERQPQGIDEAPVEFGMASGGIVAFQEGGKGKYETAYDRMNRENREAAEKEKEERIAAILASGNEAGAVPYSEQMRSLGAAIDRVVPDPVMLFRRLVGDPSLQREQPQKPAQEAAPAPNVGRTADRMTPQQIERFVKKPPVEAPVRQKPSAGIPAALPLVEGAPRIEPPQEPVQPGMTYQDVMADAEKARREREAEYERRIGRPDTSAMDKLMAEYERQKAEAAGPQGGFGGLLEFMSQIAATPRGMSSFEAGAAGSRGVQALERERAAKRAGLTEKQIGLEQQKIDANKLFAKEQLGVGDAQFDRVFKANMQLLEEQGKDKRQAMSDAAAMTREQFRAEAEKEITKIRANYQRQLQAMPSAEERLRKQAMDAYKSKFPEADDYTAMQALGLVGAKGGYESAATALRAAQSTLEDPYSTPEEQVAARQTRSAILQGMRPGSTSQGQGGYTVNVGGKQYVFPTQEAANKFKAEAGVK